MGGLYAPILLPSRPNVDTGVIKTSESFQYPSISSILPVMYAFKLAATVFAFFAIQASAVSTPVPCKSINTLSNEFQANCLPRR